MRKKEDVLTQQELEEILQKYPDLAENIPNYKKQFRQSILHPELTTKSDDYINPLHHYFTKEELEDPMSEPIPKEEMEWLEKMIAHLQLLDYTRLEIKEELNK